MYEAENSPRAVLAEYIAEADDLRCVVVICVKKTGVDSDAFSYACSGSTFEALGLVDSTRDALLETVRGAL